MSSDWTGSLDDGSVEVYSASSLAASGTQVAVNQAINNLKSKSIRVFNTSKFTVNGQTLTSYKADVNTDSNYEGDTEAISDGYFHESEYRSAPYFNLIIDGIEEISDNAPEPGNSTFRSRFKKKSQGLSGGTITAIVLPIVGVIAILGVVLVVFGKSAAGAAAAENSASIANSSINQHLKV